MTQIDIKKLLQSRIARESRQGQPILNLLTVSKEIDEAATHLFKNRDTPFRSILEKSIPILSVTAIETYYRDILDSIFRMCDPDFFKPVLKDIHKSKYDIDDLVLMHEESIHPLEMISSTLNFQSVEAIDKVFSKFLKKGLWDSVIGTRVRQAVQPEPEIEFKHEYLQSLRNLFNTRHDLVHNQIHPHKELTTEFFDEISASFLLVTGSHFAISDMINKKLNKVINNAQQNTKQPN